MIKALLLQKVQLLLIYDPPQLLTYDSHNRHSRLYRSGLPLFILLTYDPP